MLSTLHFFFNLGSAISMKRNNSLNALLIIPLLIPFIILVEEIFVKIVLGPNLNFLMAYFIFSATFINFAVIQILKVQSKQMYKYVAKYFIPSTVYKFCSLTAMPAFIIGMITVLLSSYFVIYSLPADVEQQEIYRILFIHVPSAILSELIYLFLAVNGFIYLVWRTKISAIFLNSAISIGLIFTAIVLILSLIHI